MLAICLLSISAQAKRIVIAFEVPYKTISARNAKRMLIENPQALLLDVRTEAEFKEKRIPGAFLLPEEELKEKAAIALPKKEAFIVVYCLDGSKSAKAARTLNSMGYTAVYDLGGMDSWPYAIEKG